MDKTLTLDHPEERTACETAHAAVAVGESDSFAVGEGVSVSGVI